MDERLLQFVAIIVGVAFISAVIIGTTPPVGPEETGSSLDRNQIDAFYNVTPLALAILTHFFGTSINVLNVNEFSTINDLATNDLLQDVEYDDLLFIEIVKVKGETISIIAIRCSDAVQGGNRKLLIQQSEELMNLSKTTWEEVEDLTISKHFIQEKKNFQHAMVTMIAVASSFTRGLPGSENERLKMVKDISTAQEMLNSARIETSGKTNIYEDNHPAFGRYLIDVDQSSELDRAKNELDNSVLFPMPDGLLPLGRSFRYMDSTQSNDINILPRYCRIQSYYWYDDAVTGRTIHVTAPEGTSYIAVHMRVAHTGNRDGKIYTIKTPALSAFTLHGVGETFTPVQTPHYTSFGEMYVQKTLNRNEMTASTLIFEVPYGLRLSDTYLMVDLGPVYGTPGWELG